jgi:hypothetical protein
VVNNTHLPCFLYLWAGNIARIGEMRNACKILVGKAERSGRKLEDNIRVDLRE